MSDNPFRLPRHVVPTHYDIRLEPDLDTLRFDGSVGIDIDVTTSTDTIVLNTADLDIKSATLLSPSGPIAVTEMSYDEEYERVTLLLDAPAAPGSYRLEIEHSGIINDQLRGFYKSIYRDAEGNEHTIAASQFQSTDARRAFPCWDEPDFKATFQTTLVIASDLEAYTNTSELKRESL
ncbi:MAG: M1 family peptidase, partial [Acidimicrobiia bacterium]